MLLTALLVLVVAVGVMFYKEGLKRQTLEADKARAQAELDAWNKNNTEIQQEVTDSQTDDWVKQQAHEKLGMVMPGEIKIVDESN